MRILIVDDRPLGARKLRDDILTAEPAYHVEIATGEGRAADLARQIVQDAREHFNVLLIDDNLGVGLNGSELMAALRQLSPNSEAIIFTAYADEEGKRRAIETGARAYVSRPINEQELLWQLRGIQKDQSTRQERDWLKIMTEIATQMQMINDVQQLADLIVRGGLRFGFQRARLRLFEQVGREATSDPEMVGMSQAGTPQLKGFENLRLPLSRLLYSQEAINAGKPLVFRDRELGPGGNDEFFAAHGMPLPQGHWFKVPLLSDNYAIGTLTLDNGAEGHIFSPEICVQYIQALGVFGAQATSALERARLHGQAKVAAKEASLLSAISRQVTAVAARGDLNELLDEVRRQVGGVMDATNFMVVLKDLETGDLDFRRAYDEGRDEPVDRHWRSPDAGLSGYVITKNVAVLTDDTEAFREAHGIKLYGRPAACWLGVPLHVKENDLDVAVGVLAVQDYADKTAYQEQHRKLLQLVADQVAGAIQMAYRLENEAQQRRQEQALQHLHSALPRLIQESEDSFWHAVLTTVTHGDGIRFNRAALFWYDQSGENMQGRMGIGYFTRSDARRAWEDDLREERSLERFFTAPHLARGRVTPLQQEIIDWRPDTGKPDGPCYLMRFEGTRQVMSSDSLLNSLPARLLRPPDLLDGASEYPCALVPVKSDDKVMGLLVVDNAFDGKPLRSGDLDRVEIVLAEAMRVWSDHRKANQAQQLGKSYEQILALDHRLTAKIADQLLQASLKELCQGAREITKADFVVIYPLSRNSVNYDTEAIAVAGELHDSEYLGKHPPRSQGTATYVLRQGTVAITNVTTSTLEFESTSLAQQSFILREEVAAFIGVSIRTARTARPLGVLYLDYRKSQDFSASDILRAEYLASIAGKIIGNKYQVEQEAERFVREQTLLRAVQEESLVADTNETKVVSVILRTARELFDRQADTILMLRQWKLDEEQQAVHEEFQYYRWDPLTSHEVDTPSDEIGVLSEDVKNVARMAFENGTTISSGAKLAVPIKTVYRTMGCIIVNQDGKTLAERLANAAALALDNVRREVRLRAMLQAVEQVVAPTELRQTLNAVIDASKNASHGLECVMLWYRDPGSREHVLGAHWGLLAGSQDAQDPGGSATQTQHGIVKRVMQSEKPVWVENVDNATTLLEQESIKTSFVARQKIVAFAAFPLRIKNDSVGALFFNYRREHKFSPGEQHALTIFAAIAAASIHEAQLLEQLDVANTIVRAVGTELNQDRVLREVLVALKKYFDAPDVLVQPYVMLYNENEGYLYLPDVAKAFAPVDEPRFIDEFHLHLDGRDKGTVCRVANTARQKNDIYVESFSDVREEPDFLRFNSQTVSLLCAGLATTERLWGVLAVSSSKQGAFDEQDKVLLGLAARQALIAMERSEQAARLRFREAVSSVTTWAAELAHDINREVYSIRSRADWLQTREKDLSPKGQAWVREIDDVAVRLQDAARSARIDQKASLQTFDLDQALYTQVADLIARRWSNVVIQPDLGCAEIMICSYQERLWRAVRHLVRNAAEAMNGSGTLTLRTRHTEAQIEIQIEDTGPGPSSDSRAKLFNEPFTDKGDEGDRGYGLLIARHLTESLGGRIRLLPQETGRGAVFSLILPKIPAA